MTWAFLLISSYTLGVQDNRYVRSGSWDSVHVVEVREDSPTKATYTLVTTVMLTMIVEKPDVGVTDMSGSLTRKVPNHSFT